MELATTTVDLPGSHLGVLIRPARVQDALPGVVLVQEIWGVDEHIQDVAEDLANDRVYLPRQDMDAHQVTEADLAQPSASAKVSELIRFESDRARRLLDDGAPLVGTLKGAARLAIAGYVGGGRATLKAIEAGGYDVLRATLRPGKADTLAMMASCYIKGR